MFGKKKKGSLRPDVAAAVQAAGITGWPAILRGIPERLDDGESVSRLAESTNGTSLAILTSQRFAVVTKGSGMKQANLREITSAACADGGLSVSAVDQQLTVDLPPSHGQAMADAINAGRAGTA